MSIHDQLLELTAKARAEGKWLFCAYQHLWMSPDQLDEANRKGRFLWSPVNWELRDPKERINEAKNRVQHAHADLDRIRKEIGDA